MIPGQGVLAIWNGMEEGHDAEFVRWHVHEHIPERLTVPGFLRARRYAAVDGQPAYFNFYETETPDVLFSETYLSRLNDPTQWTRRVVPHFTDFSRTPCRVVASTGHGVAGFVLALRLDCDADVAAPVATALIQSQNLSAMHLLERCGEAVLETAESAMRGKKDETSRAILLAEGPMAEPLKAAVDAVLTSPEGGKTPVTATGLYRLDFMMQSSVEEDHPH